MGGSNSAGRIDAGDVDPRPTDLPDPPLFRVHDPLSWLNADGIGAAKRIPGIAARKPGKSRLFWIPVLMLAALLAAGWSGYAKPRIERAMASLGISLASAIDIDCPNPGVKRFPDDAPACR